MSDEKTIDEMLGRLSDIADALGESDDDGDTMSIVKMAGGSGKWFRVRCGEAWADATSLRGAIAEALELAEARLSQRVAAADAIAERLRAAMPPARAVRTEIRLATNADFDGVQRIVAEAVRGGLNGAA